MSGSASTSLKSVVEAVAESLRSGSHGAIRSLLSSAATFSTRERDALEKELSQAISANDPLTVAAIAIVGESLVDCSVPLMSRHFVGRIRV
jgi:RNA-splicing ligase RtcB